MLLIPLALFAAEEIDQFGIVPPGTGGRVFHPGETFQTIFQARGLKIRQGKGSVSWSFSCFMDGDLKHLIETESYSGFQNGTSWDFSREKSFTIPLEASPGNHRIEITLKDNNSGTVYRGSVFFFVSGAPADGDAELTYASAESADDEGLRVLLGDVSVTLSSVGVREYVLVCTFIVQSNNKDVWLGFRDGLIVDVSGREHQAIIGGTIQGDGWGGLNLAAGIPMKGEMLFDSYAAAIEKIVLLEVQFDGERKGQWREIPNPYP
jgi:hypothetical protein